MQPPLRKVLAESHVATATTAVLLFWASVDVFQTISELLKLLFRIANYMFTAVAIFGIPSSGPFIPADRFIAFALAYDLAYAFASFAAAWLVARWVYDDGPFCIMRTYGNKILGREHAETL